MFSVSFFISREREKYEEIEGEREKERIKHLGIYSITLYQRHGRSVRATVYCSCRMNFILYFFLFSVEFSGIRFLVLLACRLVAASSNSVSSLQEFHEFHVLLANLQRTFREFLTCDGTHTQTHFMCWANERDSVREWACQARGKVLNGISAPSFNSTEVHHIKVWFCSVYSFLFAEWQRWRHFYVRIEY